MNRFHRQLNKYRIFLIVSLILILLSIIPVRIAIALYRVPQPQAILTLGGWTDREQTAAEIARWYPSIEVWVSSGTPPKLVRPIFQAAGISQNRLHLDYRAVDTVTNFTTVVPELKQKHIHHIYLITSDYHMPRAKVIAILILGSQGIGFTPISVPSNKPKQETIFLIIRDIGRSLLWIITGHTGASLQHTIDLP